MKASLLRPTRLGDRWGHGVIAVDVYDVIGLDGDRVRLVAHFGRVVELHRCELVAANRWHRLPRYVERRTIPPPCELLPVGPRSGRGADVWAERRAEMI